MKKVKIMYGFNSSDENSLTIPYNGHDVNESLEAYDEINGTSYLQSIEEFDCIDWVIFNDHKVDDY